MKIKHLLTITLFVFSSLCNVNQKKVPLNPIFNAMLRVVSVTFPVYIDACGTYFGASDSDVKHFAVLLVNWLIFQVNYFGLVQRLNYTDTPYFIGLSSYSPYQKPVICINPESVDYTPIKCMYVGPMHLCIYIASSNVNFLKKIFWSLAALIASNSRTCFQHMSLTNM